MFSKDTTLTFVVTLTLLTFDVICINGSPSLDSQNEAFRHYTSDIFDTSFFNHITVHASNYRLNLTVSPLQYNLKLRPILDDGFPNLPPKFTVPSSVTIHVKSIYNGSCNTITLHQRNLTIDLDSVKVTNLTTGNDLQILTQIFEDDRDLYTINLKDSFNFGDELEIFIPFSSNLSLTENVGIYLGHYVNLQTNETHYLSTTKLEPYHARKVFPLFDEPSIKAKFKISVGRLDGKYHSLSNMQILETEKDSGNEGWVWDHYEESVLMSPYLVCVIVSDFANDTVYIPEINRTVSVRNFPNNSWAPKHDIDVEGGAYGSSTGAKLLSFYEEHFKMDYALKKLDAVALPQFASGAMENFGLVTYRYEYLVWIPGINTEAERRKITQVLAHEIVHQWYGNIVTCAWWSEIWLNEGFARYLQFWGMNHILPEFHIEEAFVHDATQLALVFDQGPLTHPVRNSAESPTESSAVFDRISYEKAASLLKMMEGFLGRNLLETALVDFYLQKTQWTSAKQEDLFDSIQEAIDSRNSARFLPPQTKIHDIMNEWTLTSGYPLLRVDALNQNTISISQERFTLSSSKKRSKVVPGSSWWIPVKVLTSGSLSTYNTDLWISKNDSVVTYSRDGLDTNKLLMINPDAIGYYRVLYDAKLTSFIKNQLASNHELISSPSRSQFLDDYFNLALGKYIQIETALDFTSYLEKEMASNVWTTVLTHLKPILQKFTENIDANLAFQDYFSPKLTGALNLIGLKQIEGERGINVTLRAQLLDMACQLELDSCIQYANELRNEWISKPEVNPFPVDLKTSLYCSAIGTSNAGVWDFFLGKLHEEKRSSQKTILLNSLACSKNTTILSNFLELSVNSSSNFHQYTDQILTRVAMNPVGRPIVYEFVKNNLMASRITATQFAGVVTTLSGFWGKVENVEELHKFIESNGNALEGVKTSLETSLNNIRLNIEWWSTFGNRIHVWLRN